MLAVDGARVFDACVERTLGEFRPWLTSALEAVTRGLHDHESEFYAHIFKLMVSTDAIPADAEDAARHVESEIDRHLAAAADLPEVRVSPAAVGAGLTDAAVDKVVDALESRRLVGERHREFRSALMRYWAARDDLIDLPLLPGGDGTRLSRRRECRADCLKGTPNGTASGHRTPMDQTDCRPRACSVLARCLLGALRDEQRKSPESVIRFPGSNLPRSGRRDLHPRPPEPHSAQGGPSH